YLGPHVAFVASERVLSRRIGDFTQQPASGSDELNPVLRKRRRRDFDGHRLGGDLVVGERHAGRCVEVTAFEGVHQRARLETRRSHHHPTAPWAGDRRVPRILEHVSIVDGDSVHERAGREESVPDGLEAGDAAAAEIVDLRMTVEDLEQLVATDLPELLRRDGPPEVGMIDVRDPVGGANRINRTLECVEYRRAVLRLDLAGEVEAVDVQRFAVEGVRDFLTTHDEKLLVCAVERVEAVNACEEVVIRKNKEPVTVRSVPAHDLVWRAVAVAVERVRVRVSLVPRGDGRTRLPVAGPCHADTFDQPYTDEEQEQSLPRRD